MKIAKAPWEVDGEGADARVVSAEGWTVARTEHVHCPNPDEWDEYQENTMRLIAAAPDLLEACKLAYEQLSHCDCSNGVTSPMGDIDEGNVYAGRTADALHAAIAKALGEATP